MATTGEIIKWTRTTHNLTQDELGEILGVKKSAIQKYENGSIQNLKVDVIRRFCLHFNLPPIVLIFPEDISETELNSFCMSAFIKAYTLNEAGQNRLRDYLSDIILIDKYQQKE